MRARLPFLIRCAASVATLGAAVLPLAGCGTPAPSAAPPASLAPPAWHAPLPHAGQTAELGRWWSQFDDPLLPALIDEAQASHPALDQALARIRQARAARTVAAAPGGPFAGLGAQATRSSGVATGFAPASQLSATVDAGWEIDLFDGVRHGVAAAQARAEQAELGWHDARVSLAAEVAQAYAGLRACEAVAALLGHEAASLGRSAELARLKAQAGFEAPAQARLVEAAAAQTRDRARAQQMECDLAVQALALLTGSAEPALRERLAARRGQLPVPAAFAPATLPADVLAQRPDLAAAARELQAAAAEVGVADAARRPQLTLGGSLGIGLVRTGGRSEDAVTWGFGPTLSVPLLDGGRRRAQADAARARLDEARAGYALRLRQAVREVESALLRLDTSHRREADARTAAEGLRAYLDATAERARAGSASAIEVEEARRQALAAETALRGLQREQVAAWIDLYRAVGGGWRHDAAAPAAP